MRSMIQKYSKMEEVSHIFIEVQLNGRDSFTFLSLVLPLRVHLERISRVTWDHVKVVHGLKRWHEQQCTTMKKNI